MKTLILILLFASMAFGQGLIVIDSSLVSEIKGRYGIYSEIDPIPTFDGKFIVPTDCLNDKDLAEAKAKLLAVQSQGATVTIKNLPAVGETVYKDSLYQSVDGLVKCRQTHNMTIYAPHEVPALFSFYRENSDTLTWIPNEEVKVGWKRIYEGITYVCLQAHQTLETWIPPNVPALWQSEGGGTACDDWVQPTGGHDAYNIGDCVKFNGNCYESKINANVWSPSVYPQGWQQITCP